MEARILNGYFYMSYEYVGNAIMQVGPFGISQITGL